MAEEGIKAVANLVARDLEEVEGEAEEEDD